ncbi:MAG: MMPL family transporter [Proteobacteria bacterium]|nr:MMPL family transporter [Pseudomonadota bacterium]
MPDIRDRIERRFEHLAAFLCRRRWWVVIAALAVAAGLASGMARLTIDTSNEGFLHPDDPILVQYDAFKDMFGREDMILVAIEPREVFTQETLRRIKALHEDLADNVPHLNDITSLANARNTYGDGDRLVVDDLMAQWPETPEAMAALKVRVMANPLYRDRLISRDARLTTLVVELDAYSGAGEGIDVLSGFDEAASPTGKRPPLTDAENGQAVEAVRTIVEKYDAEGFRLYMAGTPTVTEALKRAMQADMKLFMGLALLAIGLCLLAMFRRFAGVFLPLLVVVLSFVSTMGAMGYSGTAIKLPTIILPSFLLAVSVGAAVHVLSIFFQHLQRTEDRVGSIVHAMGHSGLAIFMTSLTTAIGLGSFATAEVAPIADLGMFASLGVLLSLTYTVILLPALLAIIPVKPHAGVDESVPGLLDRLLDAVTDFSTGHARAVVGGSLAVIVVFTASAAQLRFSHDILSWLPEEWPVYQATRKVDRDLRGSVVVEIVVDTGRENGLYDRDILLGLDGLAHELESWERGELFVGKASSVADVLKEIHQALNENRPEFYAIPDNEKLIPQEFLLFENSGSDDLQDVVDSRFQTARFTVKAPWRDTLEYLPLLREIKTRFHETLGPDVTVTATGIMSLFSRTLSAAMWSAAKSYVIAFGAITLMMILLVGNLRLGLAAMLPNLAPIAIAMGFMWWARIPLNMFTMLVGSIAIGLAVDDTVHFMHNFRRYFAQSGDVREAVRRTLHTAGRAMLVTSVVLAIGFYIFMFASMINVIQFGFLVGSAILLALLADFLLAPALMVLLNPAAPSTSTKEDSQ